MRPIIPCQHKVKELLDNQLNKTFTAYQAVALVDGQEILNIHGGQVAEKSSTAISRGTKFDIASITKLFTTVAALKLVESGQLDLEAPVWRYLPEFVGERTIAPYPDPLNPGKFVTICADGGKVQLNEVTVKELLTHNSGMGAWYPLYRELNHSDKNLLSTAFSLALEKPFCAPRASKVVYSDLGLIVIGELLQRITKVPLAEIILGVTKPLPIAAEFNPSDKLSIPATEFRADLGRRIQGEVHDENALAMGGIAPHAGLFMTAKDLATFGEALRASTLVSKATMDAATAKVVADGDISRGIGFALSTPGPKSANGPLSEGSYGHYGFTGTSLWIDPPRRLVAVLLTNRVYFGRTSNAAITDVRRQFHAELVAAL